MNYLQVREGDVFQSTITDRLVEVVRVSDRQIFAQWCDVNILYDYEKEDFSLLIREGRIESYEVPFL